MKTVLTIAGFDPSSGAGITADLMVFAAHGLFGTAAVTALTVQSTLGVRASHPVEAEVLRKTLECLAADVRQSGVKIGMAGSSDNASIISRYIGSMKRGLSGRAVGVVVLDPVLVSSSGRSLLEASGVKKLKTELLPLVDWVTPNVGELAVLSGLTIRSRQELAQGARELQKLAGHRLDGAGRGERIGVLAKGGHLDKPDDLLLTPDGEEHWLAGERIPTNATHGTGCALASALLSRLVLGDDAVSAARQAKEYVAEAMRRAPAIGRGKGPMSLLWPLLSEQHR